MSFPAVGSNVNLPKGAAFIQRWVDGVPGSKWFRLGNASALAFSQDVTNAELFSSTEGSGALVDRRPIKTALKCAATCEEWTIDNLRLWLLGTVTSDPQAESTGRQIVIESVELDGWYEIGARQLTGVSVMQGTETLVLNTDYTVETEFGMIHILPGATHVVDGDDITVSFGHPALDLNKIRIAKDTSPIAALKFMANSANAEGVAANDEYKMWKVSIAPTGDLSVVATDYGNFQLEFSVLSDDNHPGEEYGVHIRAAAAA